MSNDPMIVNAKRQEDFDKVLISRTAQIEKLVRKFDAQLGKLGKDWQDAQFEQFRQQAISMRRVIEKFTAESRKLSGNLKQKIKHVEDYINIPEG